MTQQQQQQPQMQPRRTCIVQCVTRVFIVVVVLLIGRGQLDFLFARKRLITFTCWPATGNRAERRTGWWGVAMQNRARITHHM